MRTAGVSKSLTRAGIFKDPMTTACAIERLVHHSVILELTGPSYRAEVAQKRNQDDSVENASATDSMENQK